MKRWVSVVLLGALFAGCGSTVPPTQRTASGQPNSGELGGVAPSDSGELGSTQVTTADGRVITRGATVPGRTATGSVPRGPSSSSAFGPGVTADKIFIGLAYPTGNSANAAIGAAGITQGDPKAEDEAVIDDINKHGGLAGRKVEGVFHPVDANSAAPWDVIDQQQCDDWTQDHKIFAALAEPVSDSDTMAGCLDQRGAALISPQLSTSDAARFRRLPAYIELISMGLDRAATAEVSALKAQGWFSGWDSASGAPGPTKAKVGIVTYEGAAWAHAVDQTLVPALRAAGYPVSPDDIVRVSRESTTSDEASTGAQSSSAVLKLRRDGVSHVIVFDRKAVLTLFFTRAAESQHYRPRYGLTTQNGVQALMDGAALPAAQLAGAKGIGFYPGLDLPTAVSQGAAYTNDTKKKCLAVMKAHNITFSDANAESVGMNTCSTWWFLRDAINASGGVLTRAGLLDGIAKLGTSYLTAVNFVNRFSATQHDGVGAYRYLAFDEGCSCMKYTSGDIPAP
ncbi:MAG: hypothetical protein QOK28_11 [Actinomycetota bacterium]